MTKNTWFLIKTVILLLVTVSILYTCTKWEPLGTLEDGLAFILIGIGVYLCYAAARYAVWPGILWALGWRKIHIVGASSSIKNSNGHLIYISWRDTDIWFRNRRFVYIGMDKKFFAVKRTKDVIGMSSILLGYIDGNKFVTDLYNY